MSVTQIGSSDSLCDNLRHQPHPCDVLYYSTSYQLRKRRLPLQPTYFDANLDVIHNGLSSLNDLLGGDQLLRVASELQIRIQELKRADLSTNFTIHIRDCARFL